MKQGKNKVEPARPSPGLRPKIPKGWRRVPTGQKVKLGDKIYWDHHNTWGKPITAQVETIELVNAKEICIRRIKTAQPSAEGRSESSPSNPPTPKPPAGRRNLI